ncbi:MAG: HAD-IA family hydrolase [Dehalococcoidia bacterium]|nr:HAD-IA family hydrolase [Dehalococcoidia bacterium]
MATKVVFFDWVNTLVRMEPGTHILCAEIWKEFGIEADPMRILRGIYAAEQQVPEGRPIHWSPGTNPDSFIRYNNIVLQAAGVAPQEYDQTLLMLKQFKERFAAMKFMPSEDVRPALTKLKEQGLTTAVISNMNRPLSPFLERLHWTELLDFTITSSEISGKGKPAAPIFLEALTRAGAQPSECVHVGDESFVDGVGAIGVGITPILIDRFGLFPDFTDYRRITSLQELPELLHPL